MLDFFKKKDDDLSDFTPLGKDDDKPMPSFDSSSNPLNQGNDPLSQGSNPFSSSDHLALPSDNDHSGSNASPAAPSAFDELRNTHAQPPGAQNQMSPTQQGGIEKDVAILSAKVDAVRAILDSINHRLDKIERIAESSQKKNDEVRW
ncbi:MAG: hypothetical protein ACMXYE_05280 [Candidatus Woesearchaeota archaeon]